MNTIAAYRRLINCASLASGLCAALPLVAAAANPAGDACSLFTATQVSAALGVTVADGKHLMPTDLRTCEWASTGSSRRDSKDLTAVLGTERNFEQGKVPVTGISKEPLSAVGDEAYYITTPGIGPALWVKKGSAYAQIRVRGFSDDKAKEVEKALALQVLPRL